MKLKTVIREKLLFMFVAVLATIVSSPILASTQFIEYKKYLIPINVDKDINIYYVDDVDDSRQRGIAADPNGVQELPILIGWKNLNYFNLVGIGADGQEGVRYNTSFSQSLLNLMGDSTLVLTGDALRDSIIEKALAVGKPSNKLVIAIGGPREIVLDAIKHAKSQRTPINKLIRVVGIQACVKDVSVTNCPVSSVGMDIIEEIGQSNYHIIVDDGDPAIPGRQAPSFRWFYLARLDHVGNRDDWYKRHYHRTAIGRYFRDDRVRICRDNLTNCTLDKMNEVANGGGLLRVADFTAIAYIIWGEDIWSAQFESRMYSEIESGLATLP